MERTLLERLVGEFVKAMSKVGQVGGEDLGYFSYGRDVASALKREVLDMLIRDCNYSEYEANFFLGRYFEEDNSDPHGIEFKFNPVYGELLNITKESAAAAADGAFTVQAYGGKAPYSYRLYIGETPQGEAKDDGVFTGLTAATYIVAISDSKMDGETLDPRTTSVTVVLGTEEA